MAYIFVIAIIIGIFYYGAEAIKELGERERSFQRAYDIYIKYPHLLRNRLKNMYVDVNENSDSADEIRAKVFNNKVVRDFQIGLDGRISKANFITIWKKIINNRFYRGSGWPYIELRDIENDMEHDNIVQEEKKITESQEKKRLKDEYGKWF